MASFLPDLWASVFTPGPTPTLLVATNATFAALQAVLLALLVATYSIHFAILSVLSAGLWYAINWFAAELRVAQAAEEETAAAAAEKAKRKKRDEGPSAGGTEADDEGEDTEVEDGRASVESLGGKKGTVQSGGGGLDQGLAVATGAQADSKKVEARPRRQEDGGWSEASTDSEWEKVSPGDS